MPTINLRGRTIEYSVVRGTSRRYTYLRFKDDNVLELVVPNPKSFNAEAMIRERQVWVLKHLDRASRNLHVLTDESVMFDGKTLKVVFERTPGAESLEPNLATGEVTVKAHDRSSIRELVRRWYLRESSRYVIERLPSLAKTLGVTYRKADVREIKNWGYCTRGGRLSFSWQLIALPERLREYVLCHELVHLLEHNHSKGFRRRLASILPDHSSREKELDSTIPL